MHPSGNYPLQMEHKDGLAEWTKKNRNIYNTDIVLWYTMGVTHVSSFGQEVPKNFQIVRCEDWPLMPCEYCSFELKPDNFFDISPVMDLPPMSPKSKEYSCCAKPGPPAKL